MNKGFQPKSGATLRSVHFWLFCIALSVFAGLARTTMAQPANDNFANRIILTGDNLTVSGSLSNATSEANEPLLPGISSGQTAWWTWIAPSNGIVSLSITGTGFEPLLTVYAGSDLTDLSLVASNIYQVCYSDGDCGCHWRERGGTTFHVARGQAYQISVDSLIFTDASPGAFTTNVIAGGNLQLGLQFTPAPANDDFDNRITLKGTRTRIASSNAGATKQSGELDHLGNPGGSSVWYTWTAPATGRVSLSTNNIPQYLPSSSTDGQGYGLIDILIISPSCGMETNMNPLPQFFPLLAAYTGTAVDALAPADCLPMGLSAYPYATEFDAVKGQTYQIAFDGNMGTTGDITLYLALTKPASNDNFKNRISLHGINVAVTGYNAGATSEQGEPALPGSVGKSVWWSWTAPVSGTATIDLGGSDYTFPIGVFTGTTPANLAGVATNAGLVTFAAVQGQTYQIAIDDSSGLTGEIKFTLQIPPVELPLIQMRSSGNLTLLDYSASPGQVILLQSSSDGSTWKNVKTATAHQHQVSFTVRGNGSGTLYRALVVD